MHDGLEQELAAALMNLHGVLEALDNGEALLARDRARLVTELIQQASASSRLIIRQIATQTLYLAGLEAGLRSLADEIHALYQLTVALTVAGSPESLRASDTPAHSIVYRCIRELLINAARHARVSDATVGLRCDQGQLEITVMDKGVGFDAAAPHAGHGLFSIQERVDTLGGTLLVSSKLGQGTTVTMVVPHDSGERPLVNQDANTN